MEPVLSTQVVVAEQNDQLLNSQEEEEVLVEVEVEEQRPQVLKLNRRLVGLLRALLSHEGVVNTVVAKVGHRVAVGYTVGGSQIGAI